jgi:hypothetical protein
MTCGTMGLIDARVGFEELESTGRIIAVGRAARLLVDTGGHHHECGTGEVVIVAVANIGYGRRAVAHISRNRLRAFARSVDQDDLAGSRAQHQGERTGRRQVIARRSFSTHHAQGQARCRCAIAHCGDQTRMIDAISRQTQQCRQSQL